MDTTTQRRAVPIVRIEPREAPHKVPAQYGKGHAYQIGVTYVLEDGTRQEGSERFTKLRDAKAEYDALPGAPKYQMAASFNDEGEFWGTRTTFRLFGG